MLKDEFVLSGIEEIKKHLRCNANANPGEKVEKDRWPREYVIKHGITNLFRYDIGSHRLLYTISIENAIKTCIFLDVMSHKRYDKLFGYHTS